MITIKLSPVRMDDVPLTASVLGSTITVNDIEYDLSLLDDGDRVTKHDVLGDVIREGDDYELTLRLPHGYKAPYLTRFPEDIIMTTDGDITFPPYQGEVE